MTQSQRRVYLTRYLLDEQPRYRGASIPADAEEQKRLLRGLLNVRLPGPVSGEFLEVQDAYLQAALAERGVTDYRTIPLAEDGIRLWQGDITTLKCGAIVNAANSGLLGCFCPNHRCIDNAIHTFAGVRLREDCARIMAAQGRPEPTGSAKLTPAYDLPCDFVLHTVGPIITGAVTPEDEALLAACYRSCLALAEENGIESVAYCCISTGEFRFPNCRAAEIAVDTVREYRKHSAIEVIFNVFKDTDYAIYRDLLG